MAELNNDHAFITGGGSGIGLACAIHMARDGARVTIVGRSEERLQEGLSRIPGDATYVVADIANEASITDAISDANDRAPLTIAVANAGTGGAGPFFDTPTDDWDRVIQTNLNGTLYTFRDAGKRIAANGGGAMCAISSIAGLRTHKLMSAYCTSKAAIDMLVRNAADELGQANVRVNSVCPGLVVTDLSTVLHETDVMREDYLSCMPVNRVGQPDDIGEAVRFLCGPESSWITGVNLPVDGGHHLRRGPNLEVMST